MCESGLHTNHGASTKFMRTRHEARKKEIRNYIYLKINFLYSIFCQISVFFPQLETVHYILPDIIYLHLYLPEYQQVV